MRIADLRTWRERQRVEGATDTDADTDTDAEWIDIFSKRARIAR